MTAEFPADGDLPPFVVIGPPVPQRPVLLTVPHAGRAYRADLLAAARVPLAVLRRLEDRRADLLIKSAIEQGFTVVIAHAPRAAIDLNRAEQDCEPAALAAPVSGLRPSNRARAGLGLIPTRLAPEGNLWRDSLPLAELQRRLTTIHRPYHLCVAELLAGMRARWGRAALIDVHSMPTPVDPVDCVLGDRYGLTASAAFADHLLAVAEGHGFTAARNHPYAGAYGIERHAHRASGSAAIQLEVARHLYLCADGAMDDDGTVRVQAMVAAMADAAEAALTSGAAPFAIAAE
jgi:N-formylglutamate amidohydrolase